MSWRPCVSKGLPLAGSNPAILFSMNTAQPATVSLPLFRSCGSCANEGGLCRNPPVRLSPIRRNSGTCTSNTRHRLGKTRKSPVPPPVSKKALKAVGVCCCVIRARDPYVGLWSKGKMRTRCACMPTSLLESWKKRSDRRVLRTVRGHGLASSDGEGGISYRPSRRNRTQ